MAKADKGKKDAASDRVLATNRRARFDYELGATYEAGISLIGSEARSIRDTSPGINEAYVDIDARGEVWVRQMRIAAMVHAAFSHQEVRPRKLLLNRREIDELRAAVMKDGMTIVPVTVYYKKGRAKLQIALAEGRKKHDKRQAIKAREADLEAKAAMQRGRKDY